MSREEIVILPDTIYYVSKKQAREAEAAARALTEPPMRRGWPRALNTPLLHEDGSWRLRLRCPDGVVRRFKSRGRTPERQKARPVVRPERRYAVLERDGFRCLYCGRAASDPGVVLHVDHRVAVVLGGTSEMENLVTACADCNLGKGPRPRRKLPG